MYSVIRFAGPEIHFDELGALLNATKPGMYTGVDKVEDRFSCTLSNEANIDAHLQQIEVTIRAIAPTLERALLLAIKLEIDIAIERGDYLSRWLTVINCSALLIGLLATFEIGLVLSVYGDGDSAEPTPRS
ncbi:MAG: hypothetical protein AB7O59_20680 [Pirellulales bacterium]